MNRTTIIYVVMLGFLGVISCKTLNSEVTHNQMIAKASVQAKNLFKAPDYTSCSSGDKHEVNGYLLKNNLWGKRKVKSGLTKLCTYAKDAVVGWEWEIDNSAGGVIGYPAVEIGRSPRGDKTILEKDGFPLLVSDVEHLTVDYDFETVVKHKKYNLAFDLWLTDIAQAGSKDINTEIMIWEDYFDFSSYGDEAGTMITPFGVYTFYKGYLTNEKFNQDWKYFAFVRVSPRSSGTVDIAHFLTYLLSNAHISPSDYLASVELGNEIGNSSGLTLVKSFEWSLTKK